MGSGRVYSTSNWNRNCVHICTYSLVDIRAADQPWLQRYSPEQDTSTNSDLAEIMINIWNVNTEVFLHTLFSTKTKCYLHKAVGDYVMVFLFGSFIFHQLHHCHIIDNHCAFAGWTANRVGIAIVLNTGGQVLVPAEFAIVVIARQSIQFLKSSDMLVNDHVSIEYLHLVGIRNSKWNMWLCSESLVAWQQMWVWTGSQRVRPQRMHRCSHLSVCPVIPVCPTSCERAVCEWLLLESKWRIDTFAYLALNY